MENYQTLSKTTMGVGKNSTSLKRVRQQVFISSCWAETVYSQTVSLPPPHSSNCLGDSLRLEMERTLFATVVMVRFGVWNTNCWDLLCKSYLLPLTVSQTVKANQPLRWDVDTNSRSEAGLSARPQPVPLKDKRNRVLSASERNELRSPISNLQRFPESFCSELCSPYFQPPKVPRTFGASRILVFIEY